MTSGFPPLGFDSDLRPAVGAGTAARHTRPEVLLVGDVSSAKTMVLPSRAVIAISVETICRFPVPVPCILPNKSVTLFSDLFSFVAD